LAKLKKQKVNGKKAIKMLVNGLFQKSVHSIRSARRMR
jgi:hypothetical protein